MQAKYRAAAREIDRLEHTGLPACPALDALLIQKGEPPLKGSARLADLLRRPAIGYADLAPFDPERPDLSPAVAESVEIDIKYAGYIARQNRQVEQMRRLEDRLLPDDLDYAALQGLRLEARQKLQRIRPLNLGQASRISGVSPADVAVLMIYLERRGHSA
ncbi:tRNA uridine 5-carboxymethylaminomethyl modification enzyme MnmG [bioreactor metagenome]|uniref:tRNA uridine 5-carboxymethylaminomethyl modification enzyme MnmG n=1 Tax=bioreactor metagenome TaxID=1076179 RepID=A0A645GXY6_9ZZZZ